VCPGPNLAYYSKIATLHEMVDHIYGRIDLITHLSRPNMFVKELGLYIDYLTKKMDDQAENMSEQTGEYFYEFITNLLEGINYYKNIIHEIIEEPETVREKMLEDLDVMEEKLMVHSLQMK
jgi:uncharacterized protein (DUF2164 family)